MDGGRLNSTAGVHIVVKDVNEFHQSLMHANMEEDTPLNTTILDLSTFVTHRDSGSVFGQVVEYTPLLHTYIDPYLPFLFEYFGSSMSKFSVWFAVITALDDIFIPSSGPG